MSTHATPKGNRDKIRRAPLVCPVCGKRFSLNHSEYRRCVRAGRKPTCSRLCGRQYMRMRRDVASREAGLVPV